MKISQAEIDAHRKRFPLPFSEITFYSSFEQLLGKSPDDYSPDERYLRWNRNMDLLIAAGYDDAYQFWGTIAGSNETCNGCVNRDENRNWCVWSELPCNYNPVLKNIGMACMGLGFDGQQKLAI